MGLFERIKSFFGSGRSSELAGDKPAGSDTDAEEHAVLITVTLDGEWDLQDGLARLFELEDELSDAIDRAGVGELDGNEVGPDSFVVFCYGRHADPLWEAVAPILEKHPFPHGSFATRRYGPPERGREERVDLHWDG
ncbi:MAG: hypothetical protein R3B68_04225 [Phycisphaerales bacterium]